MNRWFMRKALPRMTSLHSLFVTVNYANLPDRDHDNLLGLCRDLHAMLLPFQHARDEFVVKPGDELDLRDGTESDGS